MSRGRIVLLYGTRPEALKQGPIAAELRALSVAPTIIATGQHTDLLDGTPAKTDLAGSCSLGLPSSGDVRHWIHEAVPQIQDALETMRPISALVVQGDTMSAYAGTVAATRSHIPLAHVEAGVRSHCSLEPWPEEAIRKSISQKAFWHYCPTENAKQNLLLEDVPAVGIRVTGNPIISAMHRYATVHPTQFPDQQILITMHRREWLEHGRDWVILTIDALFSEAEDRPDVRFLWPMHPHVLNVSGIDTKRTPLNVGITSPMPYWEAMAELSRSLGVCTDSGGLQEESCTLGVPCAVLRNVTDRPESMETGSAKLFAPSAVGMIDGIRWILGGHHERTPRNTFGDRDSAKRIALHLASLT